MRQCDTCFAACDMSNAHKVSTVWRSIRLLVVGCRNLKVWHSSLPARMFQPLVLLFATAVQAILPLQIQNHRFIQAFSAENEPNENEIFFVKGIDYQPGGSSAFQAHGNDDILTDPAICARDIFVLQQLGVNTIRIYQLNPDLNHDKCMTMLNNAGIYVILDVNSGNFGEHLNRADPKGTYNARYLERVFRFIEAFKNYPNVLGFFSGNEVVNDEKNYAEIDPPYLRALQRDMKQYISKHCNRNIPVGYSAADNTALRLATFKYLQCNSLDGHNVSSELQESRSDFYGLNSYQWCSGNSNWQTSGYGELASSFKDSGIPLIFSEYGCNKNTPRTFTEVSEGLYDGLAPSFSGGLIYEFSEEANSYGVVHINSGDGSVEYKEDLENLAIQFSKLKLPKTKQSQLPQSKVIKCNAKDIEEAYRGFGTKGFWIPSQPKEITQMIENGVVKASSGSILTNYKSPTSLDYDIKNPKGNPVQAVLTWDDKNTLNNFDKPLTSKSFINESGATFTSSQKATSTPVSHNTSSTITTSNDKGVSSKNLHFTKTAGGTSQNISRSKAGASHLLATSEAFAFAAILLSIL